MNQKDAEYELWKKYSTFQKARLCSLGPHTSYQLCDTPRHILFSLSRYKFAAKMIGEKKKVLELGCGDGLGSIILSEFTDSFTGVDFDEELISWAKENLSCKNRNYILANFMGKKFGEFDGVVSFDVVEHIYPANEDIFFKTLADNLLHNGIAIIGTPNEDTKRFSQKKVSDAHVNLYNAERLKSSMERYFNNVFVFSMNDEMIHTGYWPMAHYYIALACYKKEDV
ncbi:MAG: class I SAM-dependent methyltransferase [Patescibacteria group bacterium]|nr:class I SAM-dependent methyltransferase [Patescibacteria group bacterium]